MDKEVANDLLDKIVLRQLHLMEEKMRCEMNIEAGVNDGCINLAKTRYIMGQRAVVSTARLPTENSPEFTAGIACDSVDEDGVKQFKITKSKTSNPLRWFGVIVPQNLHKAQNIFQNTINYVVECVNIQLQIQENITNIAILKRFLGY